jgi:hypothetical protein
MCSPVLACIDFKEVFVVLAFHIVLELIVLELCSCPSTFVDCLLMYLFSISLTLTILEIELQET